MSNMNRWLALGLIPLIVLAGLVGWVGRGAVSASSVGAPPSPNTSQRTVTVIGNGKVTAQPDIAIIQVGVETRAESAGAAAQDNTQLMAKVLAALKDAGIAEKDIQTANYSLFVDQQRGPNGELLKPVQYVASNTVRATVRDLDKVGAVLDAAVTAGANQVQGISFGVADMSKLQIQAETNALDDARARAQALAERAGLQLGDVLSISENISNPPPVLGMRMLDLAPAAAQPVPVQPGELEFSAQVQVVYAIR